MVSLEIDVMGGMEGGEAGGLSSPPRQLGRACAPPGKRGGDRHATAGVGTPGRAGGRRLQVRVGRRRERDGAGGAAVFAHVRPGRAAAGAARRGRAWGAAAVVQVAGGAGGLLLCGPGVHVSIPSTHRAGARLHVGWAHPWRCRDGCARQGRAGQQGPSGSCEAGLGGL